MKRLNKVIRVLSLTLLIMGSMHCIAAAATIGEILSKPDDYYGKTATVSGKVVETFEMMGRFFSVEDQTGRIRVRTTKPMPKVMSEIEVSGTVSKELSRDGKTYPMLNEESRK